VEDEDDGVTGNEERTKGQQWSSVFSALIGGTGWFVWRVEVAVGWQLDGVPGSSLEVSGGLDEGLADVWSQCGSQFEGAVRACMGSGAFFAAGSG